MYVEDEAEKKQKKLAHMLIHGSPQSEKGSFLPQRSMMLAQTPGYTLPRILCDPTAGGLSIPPPSLDSTIE